MVKFFFLAECRNTSLTQHHPILGGIGGKMMLAFVLRFVFVQLKRRDFIPTSVTKNVTVCGGRKVMFLVI